MSRPPDDYRSHRREKARFGLAGERGGAEILVLPVRAGNAEEPAFTRRGSWREARQRRRRMWRRLLIGFALLAALVVGLAFLPNRETTVLTVAAPAVAPAVSPPEPANPEANPARTEFATANGPEMADSDLAGDPAALQDRLEEIAVYYGGVYGVEISDPSSGQTASLGADETFFAASIGKLPTLLSLYKAAARGEVDLDAEITMLASDVQAYGTGVLHTQPVGTTMTLRECAYYLINDSDNTAWKMLTRYLSVEKIQADLTNIGAYNTAYWDPNTTTASDTLLILQKIADPSFTSPELSEEMLYAMTETFSEDRIPAGLPPEVRVAHKIGTYGTSFSDAGIVFSGDAASGEHYFIVAFTDGMGEATAGAAIQEISTAAHQTFGPSESGQ